MHGAEFRCELQLRIADRTRPYWRTKAMHSFPGS